MNFVESRNTKDSFVKKYFSSTFDFIRIKLPAFPCTVNPVNVSITTNLERIYRGRGIDKIITLCENNGEKSVWYLDRKEYQQKGKWVMHDARIFQRVRNDAKDGWKSFRKILSRLEKDGVGKINLKGEYASFMQAYMNLFSTYYAITGPVTNGEYGDVLVSDILNKYGSSREIHDAINILCRPRHSFMLQEKQDLKKILQRIKVNRVQNISLRQLKKSSANIYHLLVQHQKKYYWVTNNYRHARYLGLQYFLREINKLSNSEKDEKEISARSLSKHIQAKDRKLLQKIGIVTGMQDERKRLNMISHYWNFEYLKAIAKKTKVSYTLLQFASLQEVTSLLETGKINVGQLSQRRKGCININFKDGKEYWLTENDYRSFKKAVLESKKSQRTLIRGITANRGKVTGRAVIVLNVSKGSKKIQKGDIVITSMTRPEFLPHLRFVRAIVTDEGGITSHAAIISRELNIPCIIGTRNATKVLHDGDMVEVDAEKGTVRRIG